MRQRILLAAVGTVISLTIASPAKAQARDSLLALIEQTFPKCTGISNVERGDSKFRLYVSTPFQSIYEFDLDDLRKPYNSGVTVDLSCKGGYCIQSMGAVGGKWQKLKALTQIPVMCGANSGEVNALINAYISQYGN
jgi:hypothetical protein